MANEANLLRGLEPAVRPIGTPAPPPAQRAGGPGEFQRVLEGISEKPLRFSAHARERLASRGVHLSEPELRALDDAAHRAEAKGAKDALMLMDKLGMIVNVPNRTVLTVLPEDRMSEGIVTQIDSAVLVRPPEQPEDPAAPLLNL